MCQRRRALEKEDATEQTHYHLGRYREHEFAQGVGDCALALTVAQTLSHDNGHHCPGSYYQPYMSLVHITLKEYEQYKHSPLRQKRSSFAVETYDAVKRQRMM